MNFLSKTVLGAIAAGVLVLSGPAEGQTKTQTKTQTKKTQSTTKSSGTTSRSTASSNSPGMNDDAGTIQTQVKKGQNSDPLYLKFQFLTQSYIYQQDLEDGGRTLASTYNYVGVNWRFADYNYLAFRVPFSTYNPKYVGEPTAEMEDVYFNYWHSNLARLGEDTRLQGMARVYLPTGEDSRFMDKRQGAVRLTGMIVSQLSKNWDFSYFVYGQYNNNSQETYRIGNAVYTNIDETVVQGASIGYDVSENFNISQFIGSTHNFAQAGEFSDDEHEFNSITALYYRIFDGVTASLAVHNDVTMGNDERSFEFGRTQDLTYVLSLAASL